MKATKLKLKEDIKKGWQIESVERPKPDPQQILVKLMEQSSKENQEVIRNLAKSINELIKAQDQYSKKETVVRVEIPKEKKTKKEWHFTINRNRNGFIENITAKEI